MRVVMCLVLSASFVGICGTRMTKKESHMTVPQLINVAGYPCEKHRAVTEDGYILQLHRIPAGKRTARKAEQYSKKGKKAILLVHGLLGSSGDFVIMGPRRSLAYLLADAGYDVWLGNLRGTIYSSHKNYTKANPKFWKFSFHEHGKYDTTAMVDKVLNVTGLSKVMYIGFSMGTTSFFTMMSERPEYNDKVFSFVALAPAVYLDNIRYPATTLLKNFEGLMKSMRANGVIALNFNRDVLELMVSTVCNLQQPELDVCMPFIFAIVGEDYEQCDWDMYSVIITRIQPASWRQLEHFGKVAVTGVFTSWDGGLWINERPYNLTNVKVPVTLHYGENDILTEKSQILRLADELQDNGVLESVTAWPKFNHLDFTFARDVDKLLNKPLVHHIRSLFNKFASN